MLLAALRRVQAAALGPAALVLSCGNEQPCYRIALIGFH